MSKRTVTVDGVTLSEYQVRQAMAQLGVQAKIEGVQLVTNENGATVYVAMPLADVQDALEGEDTGHTHLFVSLNVLEGSLCVWKLMGDDRLATVDEAVAALKEGMGR